MAKKAGGPAWLMTFADLMSLLMAVFVLLYAMSSLEIPKYKAAVESLTDALGHGSVLSDEQAAYFHSLDVGKTKFPIDNKSIKNELYPLYHELIENFFGQRGRSSIRIDYINRSDEIRVTFPEQIAFDPGKAELKPQFIDMLSNFEGFYKEDVLVKVIGHTDMRPVVGGRFKSNWELSSARAASVIVELVKRGIIRASQAQAIGLADTAPLTTGTTEQELAKNRRVEVLIVPLDGGPNVKH
ncbi:flagellar motor protein MotB [Thiomicrorhabdus sp. ZW0627]|uniref:OmpA/MotB family protein n=1 Tax=Thiomicrorhabdus sp. ZW0627 TaxID=3039774 RepID=UPI002436C0DD|nr:flagellar motor protein MotB [Thiomicrorhabdus sp. ZW0627]MDG6773403.1 flagellar motor protein MotB [Thiomicrorhabdus sp. ZW0627]